MGREGDKRSKMLGKWELGKSWCRQEEGVVGWWIGRKAGRLR